MLESILLAIAQSHEPPVMRSLRPYGVLRALYDSHSQDPASGIVELSARDVLRDFLMSGAGAPGMAPRLETIAAAQTPVERATAAVEWLSNVRDVAAQYLPADMLGATPGGVFTSIPTRSTASKTPVFRDLAPDVFWATEALIRLVQREAAALAPDRATAGAGVLDDAARGDSGGRNILTMSMPTTSRRALTVLVVPRAHTDEIVAVLADYSAVGLLAAFAWVEAADVGGASTPATVVRDGRSEPVVLQQLLTTERYDRIRVAVLVPIEASPAERVPLVSEQAVEQIVRSSSMGARISLLRVLPTRGRRGGGTGHPDPAGLEGWHNLLVAPEDFAGPRPGCGAVGPDRPIRSISRSTAHR